MPSAKMSPALGMHSFGSSKPPLPDAGITETMSSANPSWSSSSAL